MLHIGKSTAMSCVQATVNIFPIFVALYATGFMMHMVERWESITWTTAAVALSILTIVLAKQRIVFIVFLILTTAYFLLVHLPDVANHINLFIFCNVLLILGFACSYGREDFSAYFETLLAPLRLMLIVTFTIAGFHKLNYDFLNPQVSCIRDFLGRFRWSLTESIFHEPLTIPALTFVGLIGVLVVVLGPQRIGRLSWWLLPGGLAVVIGASLFAVDLRPLTERQITLLVLGIAGLIVFWQLVEGLLLLIPRLQAFFICFALLFHTYLGMIGFVDFQSLALALLLTFVPKPVLAAWHQERYFRLGSFRFDRVHAYVGVNLLAGFLTGINLHVTPLFEPSNIKAMQGILFNSGVLILIWPLLFALLRGTREWRWRGVPVFDSRTPRFLYLLPLLLLLFGMTSYFGLRTAGNFSMFSNLRTEGATSNHLVLGTNPLKIWGYQEDTVRALEVGDAAYRGSPFATVFQKGLELPVVEFRKLIATWAEEGMVIPIAFEYQGKTYASDNIATDQIWRPMGWDWEMILLDFRAIQPEGPNKCRW